VRHIAVVVWMAALTMSSPASSSKYYATVLCIGVAWCLFVCVGIARSIASLVAIRGCDNVAADCLSRSPLDE